MVMVASDQKLWVLDLSIYKLRLILWQLCFALGSFETVECIL
jgi:hypothetical protein